MDKETKTKIKTKEEIEQEKIKEKAEGLAEALGEVTREIQAKADEIKSDGKEICFLQDEKKGFIFHGASSNQDFFQLVNAGLGSFDVMQKKRKGARPSYIA